MDLILLFVAPGVILLGAELFTNGIEWFGHRLDLAEGAVGSVLAGIATALPETPHSGDRHLGRSVRTALLTSAEIGGGSDPKVFMLATPAMFRQGAILLFARVDGDRPM